MIRKRWLKDPRLDTSNIPPITMTHTSTEERIRAPGVLLANPLENQPKVQTVTTPPPPTQTVPSQVAFHETQSALKPILKWIRTQEDLDFVIEGLNAIHEDQESSTPRKLTLHDPPVPTRVGRPRTARLTAGREGKGPKSNGGGGQHYHVPPPKPMQLPALKPLRVTKQSEMESGRSADRLQCHDSWTSNRARRTWTVAMRARSLGDRNHARTMVERTVVLE
ncbi:hypothetical protein M407DRAFT_25535 [Tulasnella calospora MUT 4182]|uniref:Uncharacterized protein n=1 Tax=Tulasnella calospora MUT 4182 TaxID=1051891 RepID=A0A0C3Q6Q4_9AGAM|nr:hypothetical protein M407DRAFT_25535 [Tulasnella calospora MUT 4182]